MKRKKGMYAVSNEHIVGSFQLMKSINKSLILNIIRTEKQISRAEIAKITKLTPPTVTNIVSELLAEGIVVEGQAGPSSGGRKPILLSINEKSYYIIGVDVGVHQARFALTNLNAEIVEMKEVSIEPGIEKDSFLNLLKKHIAFLLEQRTVAREKILGIGIGMHGIVDCEQGIAIYAPNLYLKNIPLKEVLEREFQVPVLVENDARAMALGESWFGNGKDVDDIICINVGIGIGAGIIMNNKLFRGENGIAGEVGHTIIDLNGPRCTCGNYGCLQTLAAHEGIKHLVRKEISLGKRTKILELINGNTNDINGKIVHEAAMQGDAVAIQVLETVGRYLGIACTNLINLINPKRILIGGGISKAGDWILQPLKEIVQQRALTEEAKQTDIMQTSLGDMATVVGAVTLVLESFFIPNTDSGRKLA
jgi:glucokinase-like ROK family protein